MPKFVLDMGSPEGARQFAALDEFTQGYIEAMFWTETGTGDDEQLEHASFAELDQDALAAIIADCEEFQYENRADLDEAFDNGRIKGYDAKAAGRDFWLTRNRHGAGFWDRGLGGVGNTLSDAAKGYSTRYIYRADIGAICYA